MGCIGVGGMGTHNLKNFLEQNGVQILAVCDVDTERCNKGAELVNSKYGHRDYSLQDDFYEVLAARTLIL